MTSNYSDYYDFTKVYNEQSSEDVSVQYIGNGRDDEVVLWAGFLLLVTFVLLCVYDYYDQPEIIEGDAEDGSEEWRQEPEQVLHDYNVESPPVNISPSPRNQDNEEETATADFENEVLPSPNTVQAEMFRKQRTSEVTQDTSSIKKEHKSSSQSVETGLDQVRHRKKAEKSPPPESAEEPAGRRYSERLQDIHDRHTTF